MQTYQNTFVVVTKAIVDLKILELMQMLCLVIGILIPCF